MSSSDTPPATALPRTKAEGSFLAFAAGDALGWPQEFASRGRARASAPATVEFRDWERRSGGRFYAHTELIRAGEYSDDTQLMLAIARCRLQGGPKNWWSRFTRNELPLWSAYERGGGGATKRAADSWLRGTPPWKQTNEEAVAKYFEAGGNGAAMRVLSHALHFSGAEDSAPLLYDVLLDGAATHGHPRALIGASVYAFATWWLLRTQRTLGFGELVSVLLDNSSKWGALPAGAPARNGWLEAATRSLGNYAELWRQVTDEMISLLSHVRDGLAAGALADDVEILDSLGAFSSSKGSGTISAAASVYLAARYAPQPVQGILRAAFAVGADTDTVAAMTGGLLGSLAGTDWIPREWMTVQDCEYLRQLANMLAVRSSPTENVDFPPVNQKTVDALFAAVRSRANEELDFGGARRVRIVDSVKPVAASATTSVETWQLRASDGQILYVTKLGRKAKGERQSSDREKRKFESDAPRAPIAERTEARAAGVKLTVADLGKSVSFYEGALNLQPIKKTPRFVCFGALSLVDARYAMELSGDLLSLNAPSTRNRVEIHVADLDACLERLLTQGARVSSRIATMPWGERSLHLKDPDGNVVELVERKSLPGDRG